MPDPVLFLGVSLCYSSADFGEGVISPDITMGLGRGDRDQCPLSSFTPLYPEAGDIPVSLEAKCIQGWPSSPSVLRLGPVPPQETIFLAV